MSVLLDYLNILDKDAGARDAHDSAPSAAMTAFGLADYEQAAVLSLNGTLDVAILIGICSNVLPSVTMPLDTY